MTALAPLLLMLLPAQAARVIVGVEDPARPAGLMAALVPADGTLDRCFGRARLCFVDLPRPTDAVLDRLRHTQGVRHVQRDGPMPLVGSAPPPPDDAAGTEDCPDQWELVSVDAAAAWQIADGRDAPVVAIQDGGFLKSHVELQGRTSGEWDYGDGDSSADISWNVGVPGHGTFIAGLVAAVPDNGQGRAGLAPHAQLNMQKIADSSGAFYWSYAIAAMADLADGDLGVRVLNYSIASSSSTEAFHDAVGALEDAGILLVAAAANCGSADCWDADNDQYPLYPASYTDPHVVAVAGSTQGDGFNSYSHFGVQSVDLAAPGVDLCSLGVGSDTDTVSSAGTSYAAPLVAAAAALIWEAHPDLNTTEVARVLRASSRDSAALADRVQSGGTLDAHAALTTAVPRTQAPVDALLPGDLAWTLGFENVGAAGLACWVLSHPDAIELVAVQDVQTGACWDLQTVGPGQTLELPDAGAVSPAQGQLSMACAPVDAHIVDAPVAHLRGRQMGTWDVQSRLVLTSDGADYLNSPYSAGSGDASGFLAWGASLQVSALSAEDSDPCGPADSGTGDTFAWPGDSDPPDTGAPAGADGAEDPGGCACAHGGGGAGLLLWGLLAAGLGSTRRRRLSAPGR